MLNLKGRKWLEQLRSGKKSLLITTLLLTLITTALIFLVVFMLVLQGNPLTQIDQWTYQLLQGLRTPWGDQLLVAVTELGDSATNTAIVIALLTVLLLRQQFLAAGFWLLSIGGGAGLIQILKWALQRPRPIDIYSGVSSWSFPSGHATMSVLIYGSLAILVARGLEAQRRWLPFAVAISMSLLISFSRIYLGAHWLSDVIGGMSLGWAWVTLLGIYYLRRSRHEYPIRILLLTVVLTLLLAGFWHIRSSHQDEISRYQVQQSIPE